MPTLWTFGDSFTAGHGMNGEIPEYQYADKNYKWTKLLSDELGYNLKDCSENGMTNEKILFRIIENLSNFNKTDIIIVESSTIGRYDFPFYLKSKKTKKISNAFTYYLNEIDDISYDMIHNDYELYDGNVISETEFKISKDFMQYMIPSAHYYKKSIVNLVNIVKYLHEMDVVKNVIFWNLESIRTDKVPNKQPLLFNIFDDYSHMSEFYLHDETHTGIDTYDYGWLTVFFKLQLTIWHDTNKIINDMHLSNKGHTWFANFILKKLNIDRRIKPQNIL
jgi:hypothetical protein